ncbi:hypothetical protein M406DRAFT_327059 [Cryphonectria parasitica EP155]|uniref:Uncharacterized protein n=1 Tax=Cryphonectria parasitica (strain ATCC 38755 / EP155) TaxID=660469 RepID=A0A9P5CSI3_CRYP1|nr:uncharacterized protein M406DRAFT_327059 [Cryphonectria parasitica EP155]KAF3768632.1 hypothetical protein M406DRAFT_327059 [Cryphonectria parasitica EP155]
MDEVLRILPHLCQGVFLDYSGARGQKYLQKNGSMLLSYVSGADKAQLWFVIEGQFQYSDIFARNMGTFLNNHRDRMAILPFGPGCTCTDKSVLEVDIGMQPQALFQRIWSNYLDHGARLMVQSTATRLSPTEHAGWYNLGTQAMVDNFIDQYQGLLLQNYLSVSSYWEKYAKHVPEYVSFLRPVDAQNLWIATLD